MKKKNLFTLIFGFCFSIGFGQVPSNIPTNGLVGWYPFNGNANDESGNGNNGTVSGANLTTDRFGNTNMAYDFNGASFISMLNAPFTNVPFTISGWMNLNDLQDNPLIGLGELGATTSKRLYFQPDYSGSKPGIGIEGVNDITSTNSIMTIGSWHHLVAVVSNYDVNSVSFYFDGVLLGANTTAGANNPLPLNNAGFTIGKHTGSSLTQFTNGKIDDIGLWNRELTQQEIIDIYGMSSQPCMDTVLITVTDTLIINRNITSLNPLSFENSIKLYPNPSNDILNIDFGNNFLSMNGFVLKVNNSANQTIYSTPITTQNTSTNIISWANGVYFVYLLDDNGNTIDVRKIILQ